MKTKVEDRLDVLILHLDYLNGKDLSDYIWYE